jgi:Ca2+-binding RTX toxin-like protein
VNLSLNQSEILRQQVYLVSNESSYLQSTDIFSSMKRAIGVAASPETSSEAVAEKLDASGSRRFEPESDFVEVGQTGVKVKISDLRIDQEDVTTIVGGKKYYTDSFHEKGQLLIEGSAGADRISVTQDAQGDTLVEVERNGVVASLNAGRIAGVSINLGDGDDVLSVKAENYFGGVTVSGGNGKDDLNVDVSFALKAGIVVDSGAGADKVMIRGRVSALNVSGGDGDDRIDSRGLEYSGLLKSISGDDGADLIYGGAGGSVSGGEGADLISMNEGVGLLYGNAGNDVIYGGRNDDRIDGGAGDDVLWGRAGDDVIIGGSGDDVLMGGAGGDWLSGEAGNDSLYGGASGDELASRTMIGTLELSGVSNFLSGGSGADLFAPSSASPWSKVAYAGAGSRLLDYDSSEDTIY